MSLTYKSSHYERIDLVHRTHFWFRARNHLLRRIIERFITDPRGKSFLEIGFGTGIVLELLEKMEFTTTGIDVNQKALDFARRNVRSELVRQSIFSYSPNRTYDSVGAFDVVEHLADDQDFFRRCQRFLKPGGYLFLTVPASMTLWSRVDELSDHQRRYEKDELVVKVKAAGFKIKYVSFWQLFTLIPYLIWRATVPSRKDVISQYVKVPYWLTNEVLYWILRIEKQLVTSIGLPFGGSIILVAQKSKG